MSTADTVTPLVSAPWFDADGNPLPVRALPGLSPEVVRGLECTYPGIISRALKELLETSCGLAEPSTLAFDIVTGEAARKPGRTISGVRPNFARLYSCRPNLSCGLSASQLRMPVCAAGVKSSPRARYSARIVVIGSRIGSA